MLALCDITYNGKVLRYYVNFTKGHRDTDLFVRTRNGKGAYYYEIDVEGGHQCVSEVFDKSV